MTPFVKMLKALEKRLNEEATIAVQNRGSDDPVARTVNHLCIAVGNAATDLEADWRRMNQIPETEDARS